MVSEIGGYLEMEHFGGSEYYPDAYKINLGRTALLLLLRQVKCNKLYVPYYICDTVTMAVEQAGFEVERYHLDGSMRPLIDGNILLDGNDWIYIVNYYGQLSANDIKAYKKRYGHIIVDNAQAFYEKPVENVHTIYSCRKFFGVSDGAYLYTTAPIDTIIGQDQSHERMAHILGRMEKSASEYYDTMLKVADGFNYADVKSMSEITKNILKGIDYTYVRDKRRSNYCLLKQLIPSDNLFTKKMPEAPFAYPYYCENGIELRRKLAERKIYVPTNWSCIVKECPREWNEYDWSANILPLPVDQRYGSEEMHIIAKTIKTLTC